jgi:hypothetical protein
MSQSLTALRFDMTWNSFIVWIWLVVECDLAIICISVPVLRVIVKRFLPRWAGKGGDASHNRSLPTHVSTTHHPPPTPLKQDPSMSSLAHENKSIRNADGIEMYPRPVRTDSLSSAGRHEPANHHSPIIGYDKYGQPIYRSDTPHRYEHPSMANAI